MTTVVLCLIFMCIGYLGRMYQSKKLNDAIFLENESLKKQVNDNYIALKENQQKLRDIQKAKDMVNDETITYDKDDFIKYLDKLTL